MQLIFLTEDSSRDAEIRRFSNKKTQTEMPAKQVDGLCFFLTKKCFEKNYKALIFFERRETVLAAVFKVKIPLRAADIISDSATLKAS